MGLHPRGLPPASCSSSLTTARRPGWNCPPTRPRPAGKSSPGPIPTRPPWSAAFLLEEDQEMAVYSTEGRCMIFHTAALSPKTTRTTQGVNVMTLKPKYRVEKALPLAQTPIRQRRPLPGPLPAHCGSPPSGAGPGRGADDPAVTPPSRAAAAPPNQKRKGSFFVRTGKLWAAFRPYLWITLASAVFALGFDWCYVPNQITLGGMTGLGQIIHAIVPRPSRWARAVIALNLPLFLLGWRLLGWKLLASSLFATAATSLGVDLLAACYSFPPMEPHAGLRLRRRADRAVPWDGVPPGSHHRRHRSHRPAAEAPLRPWLPMGTLVMAVDLVVIALAALAFHSLSSALYGLVSLYISSLVIDRVLYGLDNAKVAYIISDRPQEIIRSISHGAGPGRHHPPGGRGLVRGGKRRAHVRLQAEADRGPEAGGKGDRPLRLSHRVRCPRGAGPGLPQLSPA